MIRAIGRAAATAALLSTLTAGAVAAHAQVVTPKGNADGHTQGVSRPWAQAHCQAQSPLIIADRSDGVVQFTPAMEFTNCVPGTRGNGGD